MKILNAIVAVIVVLAILAGIFCAIVGICSAINGVTFVQQLTNWFKPAKDAVETTARIIFNR